MIGKSISITFLEKEFTEPLKATALEHFLTFQENQFLSIHSFPGLCNFRNSLFQHFLNVDKFNATTFYWKFLLNEKTLKIKQKQISKNSQSPKLFARYTFLGNQLKSKVSQIDISGFSVLQTSLFYSLKMQQKLFFAKLQE